MDLTRRHAVAGLSALLIGRGGVGRAAAQPRPEWEILPIESYHGKQDDIFFVDADHGWYGNGKGRVFGTSNGSRSWQLLWGKPGSYVRALGFANARTGVLGNIGTDYFPGVTDANPLYRTLDGGRSWSPATAIDGPMPKGICAIDVLREPFINAGVLDTRVTIRAGGRVGGPAQLLTSHDYGETWTSRDLGAATGAILDVQFVNGRVGFIAGASDPDVDSSNAVILRTLDGVRPGRGSTGAHVRRLDLPRTSGPVVGSAMR